MEGTRRSWLPLQKCPVPSSTVCMQSMRAALQIVLPPDPPGRAILTSACAAREGPAGAVVRLCAEGPDEQVVMQAVTEILTDGAGI